MGESPLFPFPRVLFSLVILLHTVARSPVGVRLCVTISCQGNNLVDNHNHLARGKSIVCMISRSGCLCAACSEAAGYKQEIVRWGPSVLILTVSVSVLCILKHR